MECYENKYFIKITRDEIGKMMILKKNVFKNTNDNSKYIDYDSFMQIGIRYDGKCI